MQTCKKVFKSSLWKLIHDVKNFVVASTANYCNSRIYPISGSQVGLTNVSSLWVNAYHLLILFSFCAHESPPTLCVYWVNYEDLELTKCTHFDLIKCTNVDLKVSTIHQLYPPWSHYSPNEPTMRSQCTKFKKPYLIVVHQVQVQCHSPGWH